MRKVTLKVNGQDLGAVIEDQATLLDVLRTSFSMTGTKSNCLEAECGVCTVLLDGRAVNSCILLAAQCEGCEITTIEGMASSDDLLHPLQQAFIDCGAVQCGYCIPGMIMTAAGFLKEKPHPTRAEIEEGMCGTLCRCTGYKKIVEAVQLAARANR